MESLLINDFINHHSLPVCTTSIAQNVSHRYFEIDDVARNLVVHMTPSNGMVKYENPYNKEVAIIDYDGFLTNTPHVFQQGKERCDVLVHTTNESSYFILNELKNRIPATKVLTKATSQMIATLNELNTVPTIVSFIANFTVKKCCYCNTQSTAPNPLSATVAFNRLSTISTNGLKLSNADIENFGFELWEYSGNQTIKLN
ncbi:hypothetical protein [Flavobacterium crassostreae]|uniref:Uncharacterized protein n=1 Tax=Flavobacterium crassostreae TaxID=1763534 RepID=A0A1B9E901_9FLAO|nr:hypothetical protein [Flavobacterium crassostreae]OCB78416.1 hypothetical protein LPBF_02505 [Flavobacterium crassostreae]